MAAVAIKSNLAKILIIAKIIAGVRKRFLLTPFKEDHQWHSMDKAAWEALTDRNALVEKHINNGDIIVRPASSVGGNAELIPSNIELTPVETYVGKRPEPLAPAPKPALAPTITLDPTPDPEPVKTDEDTSEGLDNDEAIVDETEAFIQSLDVAAENVKDRIADYAMDKYDQKIKRTMTPANMINELRALSNGTA